MTSRPVLRLYGGIFDLDTKDRRLLEVHRELENPSIWEDHDKAQALNRERVSLENVVKGNQSLITSITDAYELLEFVKQDQDNDIYSELLNEVDRIEKKCFRDGISAHVFW